jgi:3-dehydroquinate dehydratase
MTNEIIVTVRESKEGGSGERERDYITMKEEARED